MVKGTVAPPTTLSTLTTALVAIGFPEASSKAALTKISCCLSSPFLIFPSTSKVVPETILAVGVPTNVISLISPATTAVAAAPVDGFCPRVEKGVGGVILPHATRNNSARRVKYYYTLVI